MSSPDMSRAPAPAARSDADSSPARRASGRSLRNRKIILLLVIAVCAAPVIASYVTYYFIRPEGRTNYGELIEPQRPLAELAGVRGDGTTVRIGALEGRWLMVSMALDSCDTACAQRLYVTRQVRLTTGKDRDRVERLLITTRDAPLSPELQQAHPDLIVMRVAPDAIERAFAMPPQPTLQDAASRIYMIDPLGNLMMRYQPDIDPSKFKKDVAKLLRASKVG